MCVINGIPLGCPLFLPVRTANCVQTLKAIKDLIRLHAFNLLEYAAVVYFDFDVTLVGDVRPLLQCAATGEFLMTEGSFMSPLNAGMMALYGVRF
jgi:hypothetical protein